MRATVSGATNPKSVWAVGCLAPPDECMPKCCFRCLLHQSPGNASSAAWVVRAGNRLRGTSDAGFVETIDWDKTGEEMIVEKPMRINANFQVSLWLTPNRLNQAATNLPPPALLTLALARLNGLRQLLNIISEM